MGSRESRLLCAQSTKMKFDKNLSRDFFLHQTDMYLQFIWVEIVNHFATTLFDKIFHIKMVLKSMVFCYHNCSDLLREKFVLVECRIFFRVLRPRGVS